MLIPFSEAQETIETLKAERDLERTRLRIMCTSLGELGRFYPYLVSRTVTDFVVGIALFEPNSEGERNQKMALHYCTKCMKDTQQTPIVTPTGNHARECTVCGRLVLTGKKK